MALELAGRGYDVAIHYAGSADEAEATAADARALGVAAATLQADLLDRAQVDSLVPAAAGALGGPLSVLVNNASIFDHDRMGTITAESWDRHMHSNLEAPVFLTQAFAAQVPKGARDAGGVDGLDHIKERGGLPGLVSLQVADEMPVDVLGSAGGRLIKRPAHGFGR